MSQQFWKRPTPKVFLKINPKSGRCYYPEDDLYKITAPIDGSSPKIPKDIVIKMKYDYGYMKEEDQTNQALWEKSIERYRDKSVDIDKKNELLI